MSQSGSASFFKKFDIFKKMPRDLTEPTFCGALVSIVCTFVLVSLTVYEVNDYMKANSKAELVIDMSHRDDFVNVNIDITFFRMPCDILSLDVQDILGTHKTDVMGEDLFKNRLSSTGVNLGAETEADKHQFRGNIFERAKKELDDKQGCNIKGSFKIYRVPGNFHIASHAYGDIVMMLKQEGYHFDFSYKLNHLSFGNKQDFDYIKKNFNDLALEHPADGVEASPEFKEENNKTIPIGFKSMFYLVAVPSYFEKGLFRYHVYQLISNYEITHSPEKTQGENILMFNFEFSPITENISQNSKNFVEFMISICAIIGGVYTIAGIVDSIIYKSVSYVFKSRIGKLS